MNKHFIVSSDPMTPEQEANFRTFVAENFHWWHWLPNFWLLIDRKGDKDSDMIAEAIGRFAPEARCMVFEVEPKYWAGRVRPDKKGRLMEGWVQKNWS